MARLHTPNLTSYTLWFLRCSPGQHFKSQGHYSKSKVKSKSQYDIIHINLETNLSTKNLKYLTVSEIQPRQMLKYQGHYNKAKSRSHHDIAQLLPATNIPTKLQFPRHSPNRILKVRVTTARSKVISRSHHDVAHLHPLTNVPTKYQFLPLSTQPPN